jgi:transcriptional regulator with XRE-family HTH domain
MDFMAILNDLREAVGKDDRPHVEIAREAGIHPATFSAFMHGKRGLSIETIEQLARALHLEIRLVKPRS